ncbi:hypothetical protein EVAR_51066_1 [Eumeta japonica]|uniref:Uncharacterized protein n=1 Tax=Eumeta variegata TaxID=151549 RepID=A0A4C1XRN8_EUMVA|nr:hypothetical protein EVAR_51066_1 [Eumeta japonica]
MLRCRCSQRISESSVTPPPPLTGAIFRQRLSPRVHWPFSPVFCVITPVVNPNLAHAFNSGLSAVLPFNPDHALVLNFGPTLNFDSTLVLNFDHWSSRPSYGDDAVSYVQLKREGDICIVKCKVCPEHKVHAKLYSVTLIMDEQEEAVKSIECHDCVASQGGCKHAIAFLMWIHRRSEEPSCTSVECYWMKSKLSRAGSTLKYLTAREMSNAKPSLPSNTEVFEKFLEEGKKRRLNSCDVIKYQNDYVFDQTESCVRPLSLFYSDASADRVEERSLVPRSRSHARLRRNATMSHALSCVQPAFIDL